MKTHLHVIRFALVSAGLLLALQACGGGSPPVTPPVTAVIGAAGGTLSAANGAKVVIPPGALSADTTIGIEQTSVGSPALPSGFTTVGQMFAFTPHGQAFAAPVTITLPFNPALVPAGGTPELYKNNAQNQWEPVVGATFGSISVSGSVTSFSFPVVVIPPLERFSPSRKWSFKELLGVDATSSDVAPIPPDPNEQNGGMLYDLYDYDSLASDDISLPLPSKFAEEFPPDGRASGEVFGSESGKTYSAYAEAAGGGFASSVRVGSRTTLTQSQRFIKRDLNATLTFTVSSIVLIAKDNNAGLNRRVCPDHPSFNISSTCDVLRSEVQLTVTAVKKGQAERFWGTRGGVKLWGGAVDFNTPRWSFDPWVSVQTRDVTLWEPNDFATARLDRDNLGEFVIYLIKPLTYSVDLSSVDKDEEFTLNSFVDVKAQNRDAFMVSEFETYAAAYIRDPQKTGVIGMTATGLEAVPTTALVEFAPEAPVQPKPCLPGSGPDPAAGVIQFSAPTFTTTEGETTTPVVVTRTGGSKGAVTATVTTSNGSARAGTDYTALNASVFFGDGEDTAGTVEVPLITNTIFGEPDKTVNITLSQPGGCVALGAQTSTVLTIKDDDVPPIPTFTVGGTVTGLTGTGLVLEDRANALNFAPTGDGSFTIGIPLPAPRTYDVRVKTQPTNPLQTCSVTNGTGTISNANITNIAVNCVTPIVNGALDSSFGDGGKTFTAFGGDETALALQADGKVVMVGGSVTDFTLARYTAAGRLDPGFGSAGLVTTDMATAADQARGVAIQGDGKIVVVGSAVVGRTANNNFNYDFAVARYNTDGTPDGSFSGDGKVTTDFNLLTDVAHAVAVQSDGKIIVVGSAALTNPGFSDFALARYNPDGTLDSSFDGDGKLATDIGGRVDFARNVVVQSNQTILVSGFSEVSSRNGTGLARYTSSGALDGSFGGSGKTSVPEHRLDEGLSVQGDGKIVIAGSVNVGVFPARSSHFGVMRFGANGAPDNGFGSAGLVTLPFTALNDFGRAVALQPNGKIVVAGQSSNGANPDFAVARFNPDGTPDGSFGSGGKLTVSFFNASDSAESAVIQPDGKIVLGGFATSGTQLGYGLARVNP